MNRAAGQSSGARHGPALGHRDAGRLASAADGKQRLSGEPGPGDGVGEGIQRAGQDQGRPIAGVGRAAHRRHPGGELTRAFGVGARQHRAPSRLVPAVLGAQRRQHPSPGRKISGQPGHRGQVMRAAAAHRLAAETALRIGLVHELADDLDAAVDGLLDELRSAGPEAARHAKKLVLERPDRHVDGAAGPSVPDGSRSVSLPSAA